MGDGLLLLQQGSAGGLKAREQESQRDDREDCRELGLPEKAREETRGGKAYGPENDAADDFDGPGGVVKLWRVPLLVADDVLVDADVGQQFHARTNRVHDQHETEQGRGQQPCQHHVVGEAHDLDDTERPRRPAQPLDHLARDLSDHGRTLARILMDRRGIARLHLVK